MISPALPPALAAALDNTTHGLSRNDLALRAARMSETYRAGGNSRPIATREDALAYALVRMPATYAAVIASLNALSEACPDFAPYSLFDVGAGPATATWAAMQAFPSLTGFAAIDSNPQLRELAIELIGGDLRLSDLRYDISGATSHSPLPPADLVIASYMIGEIDPRDHASLADRLWAATRDTLVIVEPGTPTGYRNVIAVRAHLIEHGAHTVAPCPHDKACPLIAPDWCHFSRRLPRSRAHMHLKDAVVPFEDERFSYVALSRNPVDGQKSRVLAQPRITKAAVTMKLCSSQGVASVDIGRRDRNAYAQARRADWGDTFGDDPIHGI